MKWIFKAIEALSWQGIYAARFQVAKMGFGKMIVRGALRRLRKLDSDERAESWDDRWTHELELVAKILELRKDFDLSTKVVDHLARREGTFFPEAVWCQGAARMIERQDWELARDYLDRARSVARSHEGRLLFGEYITLLEESLPANLQRPGAAPRSPSRPS